MSRLRCAMRLAYIVALPAIPFAARSATAPAAADLARCAAIAAPGARLACYDTLAGRSVDRAVATRPTSAPSVPSTPAAPAAPPPSATATTTPPVPAPTAGSDARNFGLTQAQLHSAPEGPAAIEARIAKIIDNRLGQAYVVLDNGQTWTFTDADADARLGPGDPVTIRRASLGSFLMMTQSKRSYHVRRMQ